MTTPSAIKDRIVALMARVDGIVTSIDDYPEDNRPFEDHELPAAVTRLVSTQLAQVRVTRTELASGILLERWEIPTVVHVAVCSNEDPLSPNTAEMEACEPFLRSVPLYFAQRRRLDAPADDPLPALGELVYDTDPMQNTGIIRIAREETSYWGIAFTLPVLEEVTYLTW